MHLHPHEQSTRTARPTRTLRSLALLAVGVPLAAALTMSPAHAQEVAGTAGDSSTSAVRDVPWDLISPGDLICLPLPIPPHNWGWE